MERFFPLFIDIAGKNILVVGAGNVAARRIKALLKFGGDITVVAPGFSAEFNGIMSQIHNKEILYKNENTDSKISNDDSLEKKVYSGSLSYKKRRFKDSDLQGRDMVIIASDSVGENERIAALCNAMGIMKNVASDKKLCDFFFPAVVMTEDIVVGINSNGKNPGKTKEARIQIQKLLEDNDG